MADTAVPSEIEVWQKLNTALGGVAVPLNGAVPSRIALLKAVGTRLQNLGNVTDLAEVALIASDAAATLIAVEATATQVSIDAAAAAGAVAAEAAARAAAIAEVTAAQQLELGTQVGIMDKAVAQAQSVANQALTAANAVQTGNFIGSSIPEYADQAAAIAGGVPQYGLYRVGNSLQIVTTEPVVVAPPTEPTAPVTVVAHAPPSGWNLAFTDDFVRTARTGVESLDGTKWKHRSYGGTAHRGSSMWNNGVSHEATGTTVRVHVKKGADGIWYVDGFQQGKSTVVGDWAYHPGYGEFHTQFRCRYSHKRAPGVGAYALMWEATDNWGSELDWLEMPGEYKTQALATVHQDFTGEYKLYGKLPDGTDRDKYSSAYKTVDLSLWHTWDCRRTYELIDGVLHATIRIWIDGEEMVTPNNWKKSKFLTRNMVFGAASFVCPQELAGWYTVPGVNTPNDSWMELDYVYIWAPDSGAPVSGGDGSTATSTYSLSAMNPTIGTWNVNINQTNVTSLTWIVIGPAPNYTQYPAAGEEGPSVISAPVASNPIAPVFTGPGQVLKYWKTGNEAGAKYSNPTA
jgi:hypothetical protein